MVNKSKLSWGIGGLVCCILITDFALKSLNEGIGFLAILFFLGIIMGSIISIIEIIQSLRDK